MPPASPYLTYFGKIIAVIVLILAILGMFGVLPETALVIFGMIAALAIALLF